MVAMGIFSWQACTAHIRFSERAVGTEEQWYAVLNRVLRSLQPADSSKWWWGV